MIRNGALMITASLLLFFVLPASAHPKIALDAPTGRWRQIAPEAYEMISVRRDSGMTELVTLAVSGRNVEHTAMARLYIGSARIRRVERVPSGKTGSPQIALFITDGGSALPRGLYLIAEDELISRGSEEFGADSDSRHTIDPRDDREWLRQFELNSPDRVVGHRDFDVFGTGVVVAAHRHGDSSTIALHRPNTAPQIVSGLPRDAIFGDVRAFGDAIGELHLVVRSRMATERARMRTGIVRMTETGARFVRYAEWDAGFFALFGTDSNGPRSRLGMATGLRDIGPDAVVLANGTVVVVYQYIEQFQSPLTVPEGRLELVAISPTDGVGRRETLQNARWMRYAFSPHIAYTPQTNQVSVSWIAEEHPEIRSDIYRAILDADTLVQTERTNLSSTPRMVSSAFSIPGTNGISLWLQSEPRRGTMQPVVRSAGRPSPLERFFVPHEGNTAETISAVVLSIPITLFVGLVDASVLWLVGLVILYGATNLLYFRAPDAVRRHSQLLPFVALILHLGGYGIRPFSFAPAASGATEVGVLLYSVAIAAALLSVAVLRTRLCPDRGTTPADIVRTAWVGSAVFTTIVAYPAVGQFLLQLNVLLL